MYNPLSILTTAIPGAGGAPTPSGLHSEGLWIQAYKKPPALGCDPEPLGGWLPLNPGRRLHLPTALAEFQAFLLASCRDAGRHFLTAAFGSNSFGADGFGAQRHSQFHRFWCTVGFRSVANDVYNPSLRARTHSK